MTILFVILIILASVLLGLVVLIQNPKGGGLSGSIAGFSNQFMGVKQTTDVLEKFTWIFAGVIGLLCLFSAFFISPSGSQNTRTKATEVQVPAQPSAQPVQTLPGTVAPQVDTPAK